VDDLGSKTGSGMNAPDELRRRARARGTVAGFTATVFTVASVVTAAVSLGAYCLVTDASDFRALNPKATTAAPAPAAALCPIGPTEPTGGSMSVATHASPAALGRLPLDSRQHGHLRTATFALG